MYLVPLYLYNEAFPTDAVNVTNSVRCNVQFVALPPLAEIQNQKCREPSTTTV